MDRKDTACRVIALGFFDGVHVGHGALLRRVGEVAEKLGAIPSAFTFDTHPEKLIIKAPVPLLSTPMDRADLMRQYYGIRDVIVAHFDERMMKMPWREFVTHYLMEENGAVYLVAGHDFHFGYKGEGNPDRLQQLCREIGLGCDIIPRVEQDAITVSSTYIRSLVAQGEMERANYFLGHPHTMSGTVRAYRGVGSIHGLPTLDLRFHPGVLLPEEGVYACRVYLGQASYLAVVNVAPRPAPWENCVEALPLDLESINLEGAQVRLEYHKRLRPDRKFDSQADLRSEILRDEEETKNYFRLRGV